MENTYWNSKGKYQADYDRLTEQLIPPMGAASTVAGELLRAATRIAYDFYNNGMGNNTSGAVNYLREKHAIDSRTHYEIYEYSRGQVYRGNYGGDSLHTAVEKAIDTTMEQILGNPVLTSMPNTEDMFEYSDPDQEWCSECGDELEHAGWNGMCSHCEERMWAEEEEDCCYY